MMTLLLVTKMPEVQQLYFEDLNEVFGGYLDIQLCAHADELAPFERSSGISQADIVLITNPYPFPQARRQMKPTAQIVNLDFTFQKEKVEALRRFPVGTEALVCTPFYSTSHQIVRTLYESGVTNLNLYIDYRENPNISGKQFSLALTEWGRPHPPEIPHHFDLGIPKLALPTLLDIAAKADILCDALEDRIEQFCRSIATPVNYISYFYDTSALATLQFKTLMGCIDHAIAVYDQDGRIINHNQNLVELFDLPPHLMTQRIDELVPDEYFQKLIRSDRPVQDQLYTIKATGRNVVISKRRVNRNASSRNIYILIVKDVTELTDLEASLRRQIAKHGHLARYTFADIKGESPSIVRCVEKAKRIARIDKPTLIIGESGTGKELFAQSIHNASKRSKFPFVAMNCAAIPETLLGSELFGYEEGAFTGARRGGKEGLFQMAHRGTLFLDEIGELPLLTQAKLLRVLEEREIMRVGGDEIVSVDVRIIAATNRDLRALVKRGDFRLDLYYRLNTLIIDIPPLRERRGDISYLIAEFLGGNSAERHTFDPCVWDFLLSYDWEGNVRELRNCIEYMDSIGGAHLTAEDLPDYITEDYLRFSRSAAKRYAPDPSSHGLDPQVVLSVMLLLKKGPMGRYGLFHALERERPDVTEYQVRKVLHFLVQNGYVLSHRGRSGCSLTPQGEAFLLKAHEARSR